MGEEKEKEKYVKVCPKCNSLNLKVDSTLIFLGAPSNYICKECGYTDSFFPEVEITKVKEFIARQK